MKLSLVACAALLATGCSPASPGAPPDSSSSPSSPPSSSPAPSAEPPCPTSHGPTTHSGDLASDETWTAEGSPHVVEASVSVRAGRTLTIEPCAIVQMAPNANLTVAFPGTPNRGALVALGTAARPIRFEGQGWGGIFVEAPGTARLAHVTIEGGGVVAEGTGQAPVAAGLFVDHVTVHGAPVKLSRLAAFAAGSNELVISGAPDAPLAIAEHAIDSVPSGSYTGNGADEIVVGYEGAVESSATLHARGVPYRFPGGLRVGNGPDAPLAVLTIEAGNTLRFDKGTGLHVESVTGAFPASGALVAVGSSDEPIVLTSAEATPHAGDWRGLWFGGEPRPENRIENVRLAYTGADCGCVLSSCSALTQNEGAVIFTRQPPSVFFHGSTIEHGSGHGFVLGYVGARLDFASVNAFDDVAGCVETLPSAPSCPTPKPACE